MDTELKYIDLCCGIGSFHYAFRALNMKCVLACDINATARNTYESNYGMKPHGDLYDLVIEDIPKFDIICAGFPCQPFSTAGQHKGFDDSRGTIFFEIMKIVDVHKPKYLVLENVPALLSHDDGRTFKVIQDTISGAGYNIDHKIIKCSDYGIPQMRKRILIVGVRNGNPANILDFGRFKCDVNLSEYLKKPFQKKTAYTIRCGGRRSPFESKHNWDGYIVDGKEYRLTLEDALKLQGFPDTFILQGSDTEKWRQLGNTIPTIFTKMIAENIMREES
jgi:DNA (cytosine-5)-methyltransferase 1